MKRFFLVAMLSAALLLAAAACDGQSAGPGPAAGAKGGGQGLVIVIDPGHGGEDQGAIGVSGAREDKLNLAVSLLLADRFKAIGVDVVLSRTDDNVDYSGEGDTSKQKDMNNRAKLFTASDPDAIISIHMNKFDQPSVSGAQTFYWKSNAKGKRLAQCIQDALNAGIPEMNKRKIQSGDYFVLHVVDAPSALVECGFLSNPEEERLLQDPDYQGKVADCIFRGVCDFFGIDAGEGQ